MHVIVLSLTFPPDNVSTGQIVGDLVADLASRGARVTVLTTTPHYNRLTSDVDPSLRPWLGGLIRVSEQRGARVYHCAMPRKSVSAIPRIMGWIGFHMLSTMLALVAVPRAQVILAAAFPPLTVGVSAWLLGLRHRARFVYTVQELYPDIAITLGALRPGLVHGALLALERWVYRRAAAITVIAPRMRARVIEKGADPEKVRLIPNFVDLADLGPEPKDNGFSRQHGLHDKFVVSYAGNLGPAQGVAAVLDIAARLAGDPRLRFLIVGGGIERAALEARVRAERLTNCLMLDYLPFSVMRDLYATSDISLVPQAPGTGLDAVPSKVYRIMACARPVLALTEPGSDLATLVRDAQCGAVVSPADRDALADTLREAPDQVDLWRARGEAGRRHVAAHYERHAVTGQYFDLLSAVAAGRR